MCACFFNDILIYSASGLEHLQHLRVVQSALHANSLKVKHSKCTFATSSVAYLGHIISAEGVALDEYKVSAVKNWPQPTSAHDLRGFLGLAGYYIRFIKDALLTQLLRKTFYKRFWHYSFPSQTITTQRCI